MIAGRQQATSLPARAYVPVSLGFLQRKCSCGNHTMTGECAECSNERSGQQTKLRIGEAGDIYEQEADRIADQVMATPAHSAVTSSPPRVQRYAGRSAARQDAALDSVGYVLSSPGRQLEPALRQDMEQRFGNDFSRVRVHSDAAAQRSAREVDALAYTVGHDVVFAAGEFAPYSTRGQRLLAHELTHVVQQTALPDSVAVSGTGAIQQRASRAYVQRRPTASNAVDKQAQAIIDAAKDSQTTPDAGARAVAAVWAILKTYYPGEAAKVSAVEFVEKDPGLTTSPVGSGATLTGKIAVGSYFLDHIDSFARRVLQVGHELQHIDQQRGGMGGPANQNKREFLAFAWEALRDPKAGTGRLSYAMRRDMIDCALGHLFCLSSEEQKSFEAKKEALTKRRAEVNGKGGNAPTEAPTSCKPCSTGGKAASGGAPSGKVTTQPAPTQVDAGKIKPGTQKSSTEGEDKPKIEGALAVGGELEASSGGVESTAKLSFEASFPVATLVVPSGLKTRPLLAGAPLTFFNEFSLEPSIGLKRGSVAHPLLTPIAVEGSLNMVSIEWEKLTRVGAFKFGAGLGGVASAEYVPQSGEAKFEGGGELGAEVEYRLKKDSPFFAKVEAKGQVKFGKTGDAEIQWEGASFSTGAKVGVSF